MTDTKYPFVVMKRVTRGHSDATADLYLCTTGRRATWHDKPSGGTCFADYETAAAWGRKHGATAVYDKRTGALGPLYRHLK